MCFFFFIHSFACIMPGRCSSAGLLPRKITREDWNVSFTVRSASKQCELIPTRDFESDFSNPNSKCLLGCAQTPFVLHRTEAGYAFVSNAFIAKRNDRLEIFYKEELWSVVVYRDYVFSCCTFRLRGPATKQTGWAAVLSSKSQRKMQGRGQFSSAQTAIKHKPYYKGIGYCGARISTVM